MKNLAILFLLAFIGISANLESETKIGYVYMELIMNNMKETQEMQAILEKFSAEKQAIIDKKSNELNNKISDYQSKDKANELTDAGRIIAENELMTLRRNLETLTNETEQEIYSKRTVLLSPIAKKLEKAMDDVAAKYSYKYLLNSADGTGNSIVIVAPEADDLTQEVMTELGITFE